MKSKKIIGYTVGSFDMFHIGHLNILEKARSQCDYLIVGVNSDEAIQESKNKVPIVPCEERSRIISALRLVDEVIKVDIEPDGKTTDYDVRLKVDRVFIGDDHKNDPEWTGLIRNKRTTGGHVVFFPYTKTTSSTKLRIVLDDKINELLEEYMDGRTA
jgi:glycerol-3-phosphate cytidylyltransferase